MKIGLVNDLPLALEALRRAVALKPSYQIIWTAQSGQEAVQACAREVPDLILMDLIMPNMDGVEATRQIMAKTPCAILIVTVSVGANSNRVYDAMGYGALDAVDTPALGLGKQTQGASPLLTKIAAIERLMGDRTGRSETGTGADGTPARLGPGSLLALGASAGGPSALGKLLSGLPADFPASIVIIQHVDERFAPGMAEWLSRESKVPVRIAREGDQPTPGVALLASTGDHLALLAPNRLGYTPQPRDYVYRPSVDVFFQSVCQYWTGGVVGVLLTGMGRDGALGLKALRNLGHHTIAQDEASSAVYGMPKAAANLGAAVEILPLDRIAPRLVPLFGRPF